MPQLLVVNKIGRKTTILIVIVGIVVATAGGILWHHAHKANLDNVYTVETLVAKHYVLPEHETPILATVTNKNNLSTPFLQEADDGDKILIYQKAKRVIIYRPSINRIVDIGPVSIASPSSP